MVQPAAAPPHWRRPCAYGAHRIAARSAWRLEVPGVIVAGCEEPQKRLERRLLQEVRHQGKTPSLPRLVGWLAELLDGHVVLTGSDGFPLAASSPSSRRVLDRASAEVSRVITGELKSAVLDEEGFKARLIAVGRDAPHAVLATARTTPYPPHAAEAVSHVADILTLLLPNLTLDHGWSRLHQAATEVQVAILQLLMSGQAAFARRAAASIVPHALADAVRVCIVDCAGKDRLHAAEFLREEIAAPSPPGVVTAPGPEQALFDGALLVPCPAFDNHLIIVVPAHREPVSAQSPEPIDRVLRGAVAKLDSHYIGISEAVGLAHAPDAYRDASRALSVAHHVPERAWQYNSHAQITGVVEQEEARRWAETFLQPLLRLSRAERDHLFATVRLALAFPVTQVAKVLDVHRNTVTGRFKKAAHLLQLDLSDIQSCAVLDLALQIDATTPVGHHADADQRAECLEDVLTTPHARVWAEKCLAPLDTDDRDLRRTLRTWFAHNTNADCVAAELDVHPQTVRGHLRSAGRLLQRPLLSNASGCHDVVIALFILGELPAAPSACGKPHAAYFDRFRDTDADLPAVES